MQIRWVWLAAALGVLCASDALARVKGPEAREVRCAVNGRHKSTFTQQRGKRWVEDAGRDGRFTWTETRRDEWSVYLQDRRRGLRLQLDLWTKKVHMTPRNGRRSQLCVVTGVKGRGGAGKITRPRGRKCASEGKRCAFSGRATVYYGAKQSWVKKTLSGPVACTNGTFGDPLRGVRKACFVEGGRRPDPTPPVPPTPVGREDAEGLVRVPGISDRQTDALVKWAIGEAGRQAQPVCWKESQTNGVGTPLTSCRSNEEKDGALCYPKCRAGYNGVGPVCWQNCPGNFTDTGGHCLKPKAYGRGAGFPWKFGDKAFSLDGARSRCRRRHGKCEKHGEIIYPKCRAGFRPVGCCVCSPRCPGGMTDIGVSCQKKSYGRGAGRPMDCRPGEVEKAGLCYKPCPSGYDHGGPVCWKRCEGAHGTNCGAMCGHSAGKCVGEVASMVLATGELVANIAGAALTGGAANAAMKSAKVAVKTGAKVAAKTALKSALKSAARAMRRKLQKRVGARVIAYATKKSGRRAGRKLLNDYRNMVIRRAATKIALAEANKIPELREIVAMVDPTGVMEVVNAFDKPMCKPDPLPR